MTALTAMVLSRGDDYMSEENAQGKTHTKLLSLPSWISAQIGGWLQKKSTGSATITIKIHAKQGGIGTISRSFKFKETM